LRARMAYGMVSGGPGESKDRKMKTRAAVAFEAKRPLEIIELGPIDIQGFT